MWRRSDWEDRVEKARMNGVATRGFPLLDCSAPELQDALTALKAASALVQIRRLIHSTTGSFLIMVFTLATIALLYSLYWSSVMKGNQRRLQVLEPGPLWIFMLDYGLIAFSTHASKILFHDPDITLFMWSPSRLQEKVFCGCVLLYPVVFVVFITWQVVSLTRVSNGLVWSQRLSQWTDPRCRDMLIVLETAIPGWIPLLPMLVRSRVRCCMPILDQDGQVMDFAHEDLNVKSQLKEQEMDVRSAQVSQAAQEREAEKMKLKDAIENLNDVDDASKQQKRENLIRKLEKLEETEKRIKDVKANIEDTMARARQIADDADHPSRPPWMGAYEQLPSLITIAEEIKSIKQRDDSEKLDPEESFAIQEFIYQHIQQERRLLKYGIMRVITHEGYLKPAEPVKGLAEDDGERWLKTSAEYDVENEQKVIDQFGWDEPHADAQESDFIEDSAGRRLVYLGDTGLSFFMWFLSFMFRVQGVSQGGKCEWRAEPDEGWPEWQKRMGKERFADKWQWLAFDRYDQPWFCDDASENEAKFLCITFSTDRFPFRPIQNWALKSNRGRVPAVVDLHERMEMRKWLWNLLSEFMAMKIRIAFLAEQHPKFHRNWSMEDMSRLDFGDMFHDILTGDKEEQTWGSRCARHEHRDFTLMKLEDTFPMEDEPWWQACDPNDKGEVKVMLDTDVFWKDFSDASDPTAFRPRSETDLVPKRGYCSSEAFQKHPNTKFGMKRYVVKKPDGTNSDIVMDVQLKHVYPFMRYTSGFKLSVPTETLEMPNRMQFTIVIGQSKRGEEFTYIIDRLTTFISILALADTSYGGLIPSFIFMCLKLITFTNQARASWNAMDIPDDPTMAPPTARERSIKIFGVPEVTVLLLQTLTLLSIVLSYGTCPGELCALACIVITSLTMLTMNFATGLQEIERVSSSISEMQRTFEVVRRRLRTQTAAWLDGDNFMGIQFKAAPQDDLSEIYKPSLVEMVIPELGVHLSGIVKIDDLCPEDERMEMELVKTIGMWTHKRDHDDHRIASIADHWRFENDIVPSLALSLDTDQVLLRRKIPDIMVSLQCVNHISTSISSHHFDSYKTLFRPEDWDEEDNASDKKTSALLRKWGQEVDDWITKDLGGVMSERTDTKAIQTHIHDLMKKQLLSKNTRQCVKLSIGKVSFPTGGSAHHKDLAGKLAHVCVYYSNEHISRSFHIERCSKFGAIKKDETSDEWVVEINDTMLLEKKPGALKIKFGVWVVLDEREQELVAFTSDLDMSKKLFTLEDINDSDSDSQNDNGNEGTSAGEDGDPTLGRTVTPEGDASGTLREGTAHSSQPSTYARADIAPSEASRENSEDPQVARREIKRQTTMKSVASQLTERTRKPTIRKSKTSVISAQRTTMRNSQTDVADVKYLLARLQNSKTDALLHTKWKMKGSGILMPFGGDDLDPEEEKRIHDQEADKEAEKTWWLRQVSAVRQWFWNILTLKRCFPDPTPEEKFRSRGQMEFQLVTCSEEDELHDGHCLETIGDVLSGTSTLSVEKLHRHKDRWLIMAEFLRIHIGEEELKSAKGRLQLLKDLLTEWQGAPEGTNEKKWWEHKAVEHNLRRSLNSRLNVETAITSLEQELDVYKHAIKEDKGILADAGYTVEGDLVPSPIKKVSGRVMMDHSALELSQEKIDILLADADNKMDADELVLCNRLLDTLTVLRDRQQSLKKQILHYVLVSDHLKPSKTWRPDSIPPHDAQLVTRELHDVESVRFTSLEVDCTFMRQLKVKGGKEPRLINGRLSFKADMQSLRTNEAAPGTDRDELAMSAKIKALFTESQEVYIIWDGSGKWLISAREDCYFQYRLAKGSTQRYLWVKDPAPSPDKVLEYWRVWPDPDALDRTWSVTEEVRVLSKNDGEAEARLSAEDDADLDGDGEITLTETFFDQMAGFAGELVSMFTRSSEVVLPPELKACMLSISASHVSFLWKDTQIERLRPFRNLLLREYLTYTSAWSQMTSMIKVSVGRVEENLLNMFTRTLESIEKSKEPVKNEEDDDMGMPMRGMASTLSDAVGAGVRSHSMSSPSMSTAMGPTSTSALEHMTVSEVLERPANRSEKEEKRRKDEATLLKFLEEHRGRFAELASDIVSALDRDGAGDIDYEEIAVLYSKDFVHSNATVKRFQEWLRSHPDYKYLDRAWPEMIEGRELSMEEFTDAVTRDGLMFKLLWEKSTGAASTEAGGETVGGDAETNAKEKDNPVNVQLAHKIFQDLDAQLSSGISLTELVPRTTRDTGDDSLLQFNVPLTQIWEIKPEAYKKTKAMRFVVRPQFSKSPEWSALRRAIDPEWEPDPQRESLRVQMNDTYYKLWKSVIDSSHMDRPQEFVRFFAGACQEHPILNGWYMRHGIGEQVWHNEQVYVGSWRHHLYHGQGELWSSIEASKSQTERPLYKGEWRKGKRHGSGVMVWSQETHDRSDMRQAAHPHGGVTKVFEGTFDTDLFSKGKLYVAEVVCQSFPIKRYERHGSKQYHIPPPLLEASQLLLFDGTFKSDWTVAHREAMAEDETYAASNPDGVKFLNLHHVGLDDRRKNRNCYKNYFSLDHMQIQHAGFPPPDLAVATYSRFRGEAAQLYRADTAKYIDGSVYSGYYKKGLPDGRGKLIQYDRQEQAHQDARSADTGRVIATYEGQWVAALRHGKGRYETCDKLAYEGSWAHSKRNGLGTQTVPPDLQQDFGYAWYKGEWFEDTRHGHGRMAVPSDDHDQEIVYEGPFVQGERVGRGKILTNGQLVYHGFFEGDAIIATAKKPCWMQCLDHLGEQGSWYYGTLDADGNRDGRGTLYAKEAASDTDFMACVNEGKKYHDTIEGHDMRFTIYEGIWKKNLPHNEGVQYLSGLGTYRGQFQAGKRHGIGTWETHDGEWKWMPSQTEALKDAALPNWKDDMMHGVGRVVDKRHIHDNVVYIDNVCQMPFTDHGPPKTGFDNTPVLGKAFNAKTIFEKKLDEGKMARGSTIQLADKSAKINRSEGWHETEAKVMNNATKAMSMVGRADPESVDETAAPTLVREPTFLNNAVEDFFVDGGTGDNAILNGFYTKLYSTFGKPKWRLLKVQGHGTFQQTRKIETRFMSLDVVGTQAFWVINGDPEHGRVQGHGCAYASAKGAEYPSEVQVPWTVWVPSSKTMQEPLPEEIEKRTLEEEAKASRFSLMRRSRPHIDRIRVRSIVGFELSGNLGDYGPQPGTMLRHELVVNGRPVYFSETGAQYLYFVKAEESSDDDMLGTVSAKARHRASTAVSSMSMSSKKVTKYSPAANTDVEESADHVNVLKEKGAWVISDAMGQEPDGEQSLAYCTDSAATPHDISARSGWHVRVQPPGSPAGPDQFRVIGLKLRMKHWVNPEDTLATYLPDKDTSSGHADSSGASVSSRQELLPLKDKAPTSSNGK